MEENGATLRTSMCSILDGSHCSHHPFVSSWILLTQKMIPLGTTPRKNSLSRSSIPYAPADILADISTINQSTIYDYDMDVRCAMYVCDDGYYPKKRSSKCTVSTQNRSFSSFYKFLTMSKQIDGIKTIGMEGSSGHGCCKKVPIQKNHLHTTITTPQTKTKF